MNVFSWPLGWSIRPPKVSDSSRLPGANVVQECQSIGEPRADLRERCVRQENGPFSI